MARVLANDATIYVGDNGAAYCGAHLGATARYTLRNLSGQPLMEVTPELAAESAADGFPMVCECCGKEASALHTVSFLHELAEASK